MIKLHNELMSVQQKLIECQNSLIHSPVDKIEIHLDIKIKNMLDAIVNHSNELLNTKQQEILITPPPSSNTSGSADFKDDNNNFNSINLSVNRANIESLVNSLRDFKIQAIEVEKALDENSSLLK